MTDGFGKAVAAVYREMKKQFEARPIKDPTSDSPRYGAVDREVREQVIADLDGLVQRHEKASP